MKRRQERFGFVSPSLVKLTEQERIQQRIARFGQVVAPTEAKKTGSKKGHPYKK